MQATAALKACQGSLERAGDWLFSHAADLDSSVAEILRPEVELVAATAGGVFLLFCSSMSGKDQGLA